MVELKSFPFDSIADDREYPAQIFRNYFHKFLSTGVYFGKYKDYGDYSMKVVPSLELNVRVTKGAGIIKGLDFELENDAVLPIDLSLGKIRKDMVVVKADDTLAERKTTLYIKKGTETSFPELERTNDIYEICLATITVGDTKTTVELDDIEDTRRDENLAGIVTSLIDIDIQDILNDITTKKNNFFTNLDSTVKQEFEDWLQTIQDILDENTAGNLLNLINTNTQSIEGLDEDVSSINTTLGTKANIPSSKTITLLSTGWTLNTTTQKYEYTVTDSTISASDYLFVDAVDSEQAEIIAGMEWYTYNGEVKFKTDEQITEDIQLQLVIMRTKPVVETTEQEVEA